MRRWWWLVGAWLSSPALAQSYYLESTPSSNRDDALAVARAAAEADLSGRVIRLYVADQGWRYVFRTEEQATADGLTAKLSAVRADAPVTVRLIRLDDGETEVIATDSRPAAPVARTPTSAPAPAPVVRSADPEPPPLSIDRSLDVQEILRRVVRAHAGPAPGRGISTSDALLFRFERVMDGGRIRHVFARRGEDIYLQVDVVEGKGVSSRLGVVAGRAWMSGQEGAALDAERVREQIGRFSPERVLSIPLVFTGGLPAGRMYELMALGDAVRIGDQSGVELRWAGDADTPPMNLVVDTATWRIAEVTWGDDERAIQWSFEGYVDLGDGRIHPSAVVVRRGEDVIDRVSVQALDPDPTMLPEWFPMPVAGTP